MLRPFDYVRPADVPGALAALSEPGAVPLAGGTDLLPGIRQGRVSPRLVVDLKGLPPLRGIRELPDGSVWVGSLTTMRELAESTVVRGRYGALADAAAAMGCYEIRVRATLGGNVCNASPGADTIPPLVVLGARAVLSGTGGRRELLLEEFIHDTGRTALQPGEILEGFVLPPLSPGSCSTYLRSGRIKGMDLASLGVAVLAVATGVPGAVHAGETASDRRSGRHQFRVAAGAVAPTVHRISPVEQVLNRGPLSLAYVEEAKAAFARAISPRATSIRAGPEYKKYMAGVLLQLGLQRLFPDLGAGGQA
ncbi:MAG TPA: xanthine dehydrogenase family protein subunit M [Firmicutes bacterium]|nr:xanthine dehydrogenase family protein subunit M [Bacillota bacterium]